MIPSTKYDTIKVVVTKMIGTPRRGVALFAVKVSSDDPVHGIIISEERKRLGKEGIRTYSAVAKGVPSFSISKGDTIILSECIISFSKNYGAYQITFKTTRSFRRPLEALSTIPGVGAKTIGRIEEISEIVKIAPEELLCTEKGRETLVKYGLRGRKRLKEMADTYIEAEKNESGTQFLYSIGMDASWVAKIMEAFGSSTKETVENHPFFLLTIPGFPFSKIDSYFRSKGGSLLSEERIESGVLYYLDRARELLENTYLVESEIIPYAMRMLSLPKDQNSERLIKEAISLLDMQGVIVSEVVDNIKRYYSRESYDLEKRVAEGILSLRGVSCDKQEEIRVSNFCDTYKTRDGFPLVGKQREAVISCLKNRISIITGGAGTGKTTIQGAVIECCREKEFSINGTRDISTKVLLLAPTGIAADRLARATGENAVTIHRGLGYRPFHGFTYNSTNFLPFEKVIIDEGSMIPLDLMDAFLKAIDVTKTSVTFLGDKNQLPAIGPGKAFEDIIISETVSTVTLDTSYRQKGTLEINANKILANDSELIYDETTEFYEIESRSGLEEKLRNAIKRGRKSEIEFVREEISREYSELFHSKLTEIHISQNLSPENSVVLSPMKKGFAGTDAINVILQKHFNKGIDGIEKKNEKALSERRWDTIVLEGIEKRYSPEVSAIEGKSRAYKIYAGDKVLQTKNDNDLGVMNGHVMKVSEALTEIGQGGASQHVTVEKDGVSIDMPGVKTENLELGYSYTTHKSQGSEYQVVILPIFPDFSSMLYNRLYYTAYTRAKRKVIFIGRKGTLKYAIGNTNSGKKNSGLDRFLNGFL